MNVYEGQISVKLNLLTVKTSSDEINAGGVWSPARPKTSALPDV